MADERASDDPVRDDGARGAAARAIGDVPAMNELILVAREGCEFYSSAAGKVAHPRLRQLFGELAAARSRLVDDLKLHVQATGVRPVEPTAFGTRLRALYEDLLARSPDDTDRAYVARLEEVEDGLIRAFDDALAEARAPEIRKVLEFHLPRVRESHERIRALRDAASAN